MGKKKTIVQPDIDSPVILTAATREDIAEQFNALVSKHEGMTLTAGAVGRNKDDGSYSLRVDFVKK